MNQKANIKSISFIGTSNSILRIGYASKLTNNYKDKINVISNLSLGSSHSPLIPYALDTLGSNRSDFCVIDLCVNEHRANLRKLYNFSETWLALDYFLSACFKLKMMPIVLLIPPLDRHGEINRDTTTLWKVFCESNSLPFIDIYEFLIEINADNPASLYIDANHIGELASDLLAKKIINICEKMNFEDFNYKYKNVYDYSVIKDFHDKPTHIKNSRLSSVFWPLILNQNIRLELPPNSSLIGFSINAAHTNCYLKINTFNNVFYKRLDSILTNPETLMWHVVWQFIEPVCSENGFFDLEAVIDYEDDYESNDCVPKNLPSRDYLLAGNAKVELSALVCRLESDRKQVLVYKLDPNLLTDSV